MKTKAVATMAKPAGDPVVISRACPCGMTCVKHDDLLALLLAVRRFRSIAGKHQSASTEEANAWVEESVALKPFDGFTK